MRGGSIHDSGRLVAELIEHRQALPCEPKGPFGSVGRLLRANRKMTARVLNSSHTFIPCMLRTVSTNWHELDPIKPNWSKLCVEFRHWLCWRYTPSIRLVDRSATRLSRNGKVKSWLARHVKPPRDRRAQGSETATRRPGPHQTSPVLSFRLSRRLYVFTLWCQTHGHCFFSTPHDGGRAETLGLRVGRTRNTVDTGAVLSLNSSPGHWCERLLLPDNKVPLPAHNVQLPCPEHFPTTSHVPVLPPLTPKLFRKQNNEYAKRHKNFCIP
jgi:hypothetical protein